MKRFLIVVVLVFMAAGLSFAQSSNGAPSSGNTPPPAKAATSPAAKPATAQPAPAAAPAPKPAPAKAATSPAAKPAPAPKPAPAKAATSPAAKPAPAQPAPAQQTATVPVVVQPIITNPPVVNYHYYGKVYNPPQTQSQTQAPAPTTIIIPIPVPVTPMGTQTLSPQAAPAAPVPTTPSPASASAALPRRDPHTGYIIPAGPPRRTIRGVLGVERGMVTLTDASEVKWFIMGLERYIGLIEGLNIGEEAEIKGYAPSAASAARERFFQPATLILDGAEYDIGPLSAATRALPQGKFPKQKGAGAQTAPQAPADQAAQTVPAQMGPVQTAGGFQYLPIQPIVIQPAPQPQPPREEKYVPWAHAHSSPWAPHYGAMGKDIDSSSFWAQNDGVWW